MARGRSQQRAEDAAAPGSATTAATAGVAIGIDIGGTKVQGVAAPFGQGAPAAARAPTGPEATPAALEAFVRRFVEGRAATEDRSSAEGKPAPVRAPLGVAVPGLVDEEGRVAACDVLPRLVGWRPAEALGALGAPVRVLNDAEAALWNETSARVRGARQAGGAPGGVAATVAVVMVGTAVGAAFQVNGALVRGAGGAAGELGYVPVATRASDGSHAAAGGAKGVARLDEMAGGAALAARLGTDGAGVARRAAAGEAEALRAVAEAGEALGQGLASVINLLGPSVLAVGGGTARLPGYFEAAARSAERYALPAAWGACTLRRAAEDAVARGAAGYAAAETPAG